MIKVLTKGKSKKEQGKPVFLLGISNFSLRTKMAEGVRKRTYKTKINNKVVGIN